MIISQLAFGMIKKLSIDSYPNESVFSVDAGGDAMVLKNVSPTPKESFMIEGVPQGTVGLVHSHPDGPAYPSLEDMRSQVATGLEFGIIQCTSEDAGGFFTWGSNRRLPIFDRPFRHGVTDCYALIRDYYLSESGIRLKEFPRSWEWWEAGENMYLDGFERAGFKMVDRESIERGDMVLISIKGDVPIHAGIYIGNGDFLHHLGGKNGYDPSIMPRIDTVTRWQRHITHVMRHEQWQK